MHPHRLLRHEIQVTHPLSLRQLQGLQGLHKTAQDRQRRANLVRNIGNKITPHSLCLLNGGDIARQQKAATLAVHMQLYRNPLRRRADTGAPGYQNTVLEIAGSKVRGDHRITNQIGEVLLAVAPGVQVEMLGRGLVEPFNPMVSIHQHHAIGRGLHGREKIFQALVAVGKPVFVLTALANHIAGELHPLRRQALGQWRIVGTQPLQKVIELIGLNSLRHQRHKRKNPKPYQWPPSR